MNTEIGRLDQFIAGAPNPMAMFDREMRYIAASPGWLADYGLIESPVGLSHYDVFPEIDARLKGVHRRCLAGATESSDGERFARADGRIQWITWRASPWITSDGSIGGVVIASVEITARVEAQERAEDLARRLDATARRAHEAELRLKDAIDALPGGFSVYDADDRLLVLNDATRDMYARVADDMRAGAAFEDLLRLGFDRGHYGQGEDKEAWIAARMARHRNPAGAFEQLTSAGRWLRIEERRMSDGGTVVVRTDVTDLKTREREFARKSALLEATLVNMGEGILVYDAEARLMIGNARAADLLDAPQTHLEPGATLADLLRFRALRGDFGAETVEEAVRARMADFFAGAAWRGTRRLPDGRVIESSVRPLPDDGGVIFVLRDVTELAEREQRLTEALRAAEQASRTKSEFLAMASHELRTPMNAIIGQSGLLNESSLPEAERRRAQAIETAGESLLVVIDDLLEFASLDAKPPSPDAAPFDARALVEQAIALACPPSRTTRTAILRAIDPAVAATLIGDGRRIRRILVSLLDNALKHTTDGAVTVRASAAAQGEERLQLRIEVEDTGEGFPPEDAARLFEPFERGASPGRTRAAGMGLGLAICQRLADVMGGTVAAESTPGVGSRFWFEIPVRAAPSEASPRTPAAARTLRILVAEDVEANRDVMRAMLEKLGHEAHFAEDGAEALDAVRRHHFDVILMDIQMPNVDGLEATRAIRGMGGRLGGLPIIAVSAYSQDSDRQAAFGAGVSGFLAKPVRRSTLDAALRASAEGSDASPAPG